MSKMALFRACLYLPHCAAVIAADQQQILIHQLWLPEIIVQTLGNTKKLAGFFAKTVEKKETKNLQQT